jgi:hypothetical protein
MKYFLPAAILATAICGAWTPLLAQVTKSSIFDSMLPYGLFATGNYREAEKLLAKYVQEHANDKPPPYQAVAYRGASQCQLGDVGVGQSTLLEVLGALDFQKKSISAKVLSDEEIANLSVFVKGELNRCPVPIVSEAKKIPIVVPIYERKPKPNVTGEARPTLGHDFDMPKVSPTPDQPKRNGGVDLFDDRRGMLTIRKVSVQSDHLDRPHAGHLDCSCAPT